MIEMGLKATEDRGGRRQRSQGARGREVQGCWATERQLTQATVGKQERWRCGATCFGARRGRGQGSTAHWRTRMARKVTCGMGRHHRYCGQMEPRLAQQQRLQHQREAQGRGGGAGFSGLLRWDPVDGSSVSEQDKCDVQIIVHPTRRKGGCVLSSTTEEGQDYSLRHHEEQSRGDNGHCGSRRR